jgi:hypothetical protein
MQRSADVRMESAWKRIESKHHVSNKNKMLFGFRFGFVFAFWGPTRPAKSTKNGLPIVSALNLQDVGG